ncbi:MAG: hypothetical protein V7K69_00770 [Nostoc sp.]|uniref:hypothetical protein n=1 Tax=Nostoc sp. TaxID=1180 RepID=UPI002FF47560
MMILSYVRSNAEVSYCIYPFVFMERDRPTNKCNCCAWCSDRFWTVTKCGQLWINPKSDRT